jgi:hypothetical protein
MSKKTIVDLSVWSWAAAIPGLVLVPACLMALAVRERAFDTADAYGATMVALLVSAVLFLSAGAALALLAWWRAVRLTESMNYPSWAQPLLWGGIVGIITLPLFGVGLLVFWSVMLAYLVSGPDRPGVDARTTTPSKQLIRRRATQGWVLAGAGTLSAILVANLSHPGLPFHGLAWPTFMLVSAGIALAGVGAILVGTAWWGALFNARLLPDQLWFRRLRWTGVVSAITMPLLGLGAVIIAITLLSWSRSAPDGTASRTPTETLTPTLLNPRL